MSPETLSTITREAKEKYEVAAKEYTHAQIRRGVESKAKWLSQCLEFGWPKDSLDGLSATWDKFKDEAGNRRPSQKEESQGDLWDDVYDEINAHLPMEVKVPDKLIAALKSRFTITRKPQCIQAKEMG